MATIALAPKPAVLFTSITALPEKIAPKLSGVSAVGK